MAMNGRTTHEISNATPQIIIYYINNGMYTTLYKVWQHRHSICYCLAWILPRMPESILCSVHICMLYVYIYVCVLNVFHSTIILHKAYSFECLRSAIVGLAVHVTEPIAMGGLFYLFINIFSISLYIYIHDTDIYISIYV